MRPKRSQHSEALSSKLRAAVQVQGTRSKFSDAGKMARMPDPFDAVTSEEEQAQWPEFLLNLKAWLCGADAQFEGDMAFVDSHINDEVEMQSLTDDSQQRSQELHSEEISVDGTRIYSTSPIAALRAACASLGLSQHGNRSQLFARLVKHLQRHDLLASHAAQRKVLPHPQRVEEISHI